ncbi:nitroreductase family protein [Sulfobacillus acidophilus TPY]|uniref:Putative NAD(P)H nitroreductase n=1 Tax=Sulfobacillus acidophilus (strain ATCC 700253 / DSM 10332 / NAL) TaxID=679936 RepID=G8TWK8_SULAD|nr:nitroreductase family protein [Sulfobacillus acidophilus TPY]AEW05997.1 nitroreductase [Sulfobacillus acidophilus DSM 10332]
MEVLEAIRTRRSVRQLKDTPIPADQLRELLEYAVWVPNHHRTEPWRFIVIQGHAQQELADLRYHAVLESRRERPDREARAQRARDEYRQSGAVIAAVQKLDAQPERRQDDFVAVNLAVYALTLAAWDRGLGSYWSTGASLAYPPLRQWLRLSDSEALVVLLRLGYPEVIPVSRRTPAETFIEWRNSPDSMH